MDQFSSVKTYKELAAIALEGIREQGSSLYQVCGPISTGGLGDKDANIAQFLYAISALKKSGYRVFDQIPFEQSINRIASERAEEGLYEGYDFELLTDFYHPVFASGHIACVVFLPDYQSSTGAMWEKSTTHQMQIQQKFLIANWREYYDSQGEIYFS